MLYYPITINKGDEMNYNLIMYIGTALIVFGFLGFIFCEMMEREADRKLAENKAFFNAIMSKDIK